LHPHTGPLAPFVEVRGDWLPRQVLGKFTALCAVLRMLFLALTLGLERGGGNSDGGHPLPDLVFCDGVSAMVPLLRLRGLPVLFYCHFPDKLLCTDRRALLKRLYRWPLDLLEELTTGA
jgi:alpha-1,3/alpha-1,6-mannosyltransferase/myotubularin-related protein 1/2